VSDRLPLAARSKKTPIWQLEPAARLLPQPLSCAKSEVLVVTPVILSVAVPVFVIVTFCGSPLVPTYWLGKVMLVGEILAAGAGGVLPTMNARLKRVRRSNPLADLQNRFIQQ